MPCFRTYYRYALLDPFQQLILVGIIWYRLSEWDRLGNRKEDGGGCERDGRDEELCK